MNFYPFAAVFFLFWIRTISRNADWGIAFVIGVMPFGMFAAINAGGLSLILANFLAMLTIMALVARWMSRRGSGFDLALPTAGRYILFYAIYSLFSAFFLVRIFQGDFMVFPMNLASATMKVSVHYPSAMWPLQPTNSNISQSFYILLSCGFFLAAIQVARRQGLRLLEAGLVWAGAINIMLGALDFLALDALLSLIRTADYSLANKQSMAGIPRVIGGFSEPSGFGAFSAAMMGYFSMSALIGRRFRDVVLALGNLLCTIVAFSSTGTVALGVAALLIVLHTRYFLNAAASRVFGHALVILAALLVSVMCLLVLMTPALELLSDLLDRMILSKRTTLSGIERGAWAHSALTAFIETWGLGAGAGSLRGSGFVSVLLGSVGLPGLIAFVGFLAHAIGKPVLSPGSEAYRTFYASRIGAITLLCSMIMSATSPDPTLLLMSLTALAVISREGSRNTRVSERDSRHFDARSYGS